MYSVYHVYCLPVVLFSLDSANDHELVPTPNLNLNTAPLRGFAKREWDDGEDACGCVPRAAQHDLDPPRLRHWTLLRPSDLATRQECALVRLGLRSVPQHIGYRSRADCAGVDPKVSVVELGVEQHCAGYAKYFTHNTDIQHRPVPSEISCIPRGNGRRVKNTENEHRIVPSLSRVPLQDTPK